MTQRIGLCGGSFDPIHFGHLIAARDIAERLDLSRVILIPSARPPHKEGVAIADAHHRLAMVKSAVAGDPLFDVSDVELRREGLSYTFDTVGEFGSSFGPDAVLFWIIGADSLPELPTWYRIADLVARIDIVTAARPGWEAPDEADLAKAVGAEAARRLLANCHPTSAIDISATNIRERVRAGRSIQYLTPPAVASYIEAQKLYLR